jgi:hypothetical protein
MGLWADLWANLWGGVGVGIAFRFGFMKSYFLKHQPPEPRVRWRYGDLCSTVAARGRNACDELAFWAQVKANNENPSLELVEFMLNQCRTRVGLGLIGLGLSRKTFSVGTETRALFEHLRVVFVLRCLSLI